MAVTTAIPWSLATSIGRRLTIFSGGIVLLAIIYILIRAVYNLYFHPLSSYPGPKPNATSILPYVRSLVTGQLTPDIQKMHQKYGDVVRISPNELSFSNPEAWAEIYGHRQRKPNMQKDEDMYTPPLFGPKSIITSDDAGHAHYRQLLAHAFSDKALRAQESILMSYVDLLIKRLYEMGNNGNSPLDMVKWYNFTTFDLIGELSFGKSFQCLENSAYHPWVSLMFDGIKINSYFNAMKKFPGMQQLLRPFVPKKLRDAKKYIWIMSSRKLKILAMKMEKADFTRFFLRNQEKDPLTEQELQANADIFVVAGSETTATLLSGVSYHLCRNPEALQKLCKEIRETFKSEDEITITGCYGLKYLLAVLDEGLRMYPPTPTGFTRKVPPGGEVMSGKFVPGGTTVPVQTWTACHLPKHFEHPMSFIPERFMGDPRFVNDRRDVLQPFSTGLRNCLGKNLAYAEMRLILAKVLWHFDLKLGPGCDSWVEKQEIHILFEKGPLNMYLTPVKR